jgi:hypothetical protein
VSRSQLVRTQPCSEADAQRRFGHARKFLEVARLTASETDTDYVSVSAALAVLAGIAASDAACCGALGRRSRGQDHHEAEDLLRQIEPGGKTAATTLRRLVNLKDEAHYGFLDVSGQDLHAAIRQAEALVSFAETILKR